MCFLKNKYNIELPQASHPGVSPQGEYELWGAGRGDLLQNYLGQDLKFKPLSKLPSVQQRGVDDVSVDELQTK